MNIGFVFNPSNPYLNGRRAQINMRKFFFDALPQVADVTFYGEEDELDLTPHADKHDAWVFFDAVAWGLPKRLRGVRAIRAPKICMIGDCHGADKVCPSYGMTKIEACKALGFDAYFFQHTPDYFYRFFPADWTYWWVPFGIDAELYREVKPWAERRRDKVLLTGVLGPEYYPLRTALAKDARMHYHVPGSYSGQDYSPGEYDGDRYKLLLEQWGGAVASGYSVLCKHFETPAAGCLTFAYCGSNDLSCTTGLGHYNGVMLASSLETMQEDIDEFLAESGNSKWKQIADEGRRYVLSRFTHLKMADRLVSRICELL